MFSSSNESLGADSLVDSFVSRQKYGSLHTVNPKTMARQICNHCSLVEIWPRSLRQNLVAGYRSWLLSINPGTHFLALCTLNIN